jgi:hypothetical protein
LTGNRTLVAADDIVMAVANAAEDSLARALDGQIPLQVIGDAAAPRQAPYAIHDGRRVALDL